MVDATEYRRAMGLLANGVTVLTTPSPRGHDVMTASAVMSVSLDPVLLLVSVGTGCAWRATARASARFAVNVLRADQEELSRWCASRDRHDRPEQLLSRPHTVTPRGLLLLDGALASFECELYATYPAGDHDLLVGEVVALRTGAVGDPLVHFRGEYGTVAAAVGAG